MASSDSEPGRPDPRPLIGLTTYLEQARTGVWDVPASFLPKVYLDGVTRAGGVAILLPPQPVTAGIAAEVVRRLDGLIVTGGKDVDPARYGQVPHPANDEPRPERDAWEDALLTAAIETEVPFLGICRGLQVLNTLRGGSLIQHLPDVVGDDRYSKGNGVFALNEAAIDPDSLLADVLEHDVSVDVQSYHHQAVDRPGEGLRVVARSSDGIVQAMELEGTRFGLGVQWHPEQAADPRLFEALVAAARAHAASRTPAVPA